MKTLVVLSTLFLSLGAHAASKDALQAVLASDALSAAEQKYGRDITDVKETAVYRCPGCFSFEVTVGRGEASKVLVFGTRGQLGQGGLTYVVSGGEVKPERTRCLALGRVANEDKACARHTSREACESKDKWEWCKWE